MSVTKSLLLGVHWLLKTCPKPGTTHALSYKYSNFFLHHEKLCGKTQNSKTIKIYRYLQCLWAHTVSCESVWGPLLRPSWRSKASWEASWRPSEVVLGACFFTSAFSKDVLNKITTFAVLRGSKTGLKSLRRRLALAQRPFQTIVSFRINFLVA